MTVLQDARKDAQYFETHADAGHFSPSNAHYHDAITDAQTLAKNLRRVIYANNPPASIEERLSSIESALAAIGGRLESLVSDIANQTKTAVDNAAARVISAIGDVDALKTQLATAQQAQADAEKALADLQADQAADAQTLAGTITVADGIAATPV